jgi:hypothetical protein
MFTSDASGGGPAAPLKIVPVRPAAPEQAAPAAADGGPRRTLGRYLPSRRTLGRGNPSRRTLGRYLPSRRTLGRYTP